MNYDSLKMFDSVYLSNVQSKTVVSSIKIFVKYSNTSVNRYSVIGSLDCTNLF